MSRSSSKRRKEEREAGEAAAIRATARRRKRSALQRRGAAGLEFGKASTSLLQRRLRIGYGRAAHLIDLMERDGIVGAADGPKPREVLKRPDWISESRRVDALSSGVTAVCAVRMSGCSVF